MHASSLYVGGASFDIRSSHSGPPPLELGNAVPLLLRNRTTADRLQPNADAPVTDSVPAQRTLGCLPHEELTVWTPETSLFPWRGGFTMSRRCHARYLLHGRVLRTVVESDSTIRPLNESLKMTIFWSNTFFFFSVIRKCFSLSRILNRNLMFGKDACVHAKRLHSCPTLCNPMDCSPPGSSVHGDSLDKNTGVGCHVPSSRGSSWPRDWIRVSYVSCIVRKVL